MRTAINSFFIIFFIMGVVFSCETDEVTKSDPKSFFELDGEKIKLSQAFMDVSETNNGNHVFEIYLIGNGLSYNLTDNMYEESGDIIQLSLVLPDALIPSGSTSYIYEEWSDQPEPNTFIYSSVRTDCDSEESCNGSYYMDMMDGAISVTKVNASYEIDFTLMFTNSIIEGQYSGTITRRTN